MKNLMKIYWFMTFHIKTLFGSKPLSIRVYEGIRYLVLFGTQKYDPIYDKIRYVISQKVVLHILFLIILQKLRMILSILYLQKKHWTWIMLSHLLIQLLIKIIQINIDMIYFDRIDVSEWTDVNKTSESKECDLFHYWYFLGKGFRFQIYVCNGCLDLLINVRKSWWWCYFKHKRRCLLL